MWDFQIGHRAIPFVRMSLALRQPGTWRPPAPASCLLSNAIGRPKPVIPRLTPQPYPLLSTMMPRITRPEIGSSDERVVNTGPVVFVLLSNVFRYSRASRMSIRSLLNKMMVCLWGEQIAYHFLQRRFACERVTTSRYSAQDLHELFSHVIRCFCRRVHATIAREQMAGSSQHTFVYGRSLRSPPAHHS